MEVTNNSSNGFAPKLGSVSARSISNDTFSTHLQETTPRTRSDARPQTREPRSEDRSARTEERSDASERADAAEEKREAQSREAEANSQDRDEGDNAPREEASASGTSDGPALQTAVTENIEQSDEEHLTVGEHTSATSPSEFSDELAAAEEAATDSGANQQASSNEAGESASTGGTTGLASATDGVETALTGNGGLTDTATAQHDAVRETAQNTNAANIATAEAATANADRPLANANAATTQTGQQANLNAEGATGAADEDTGLPNPLGASTEGDADAEGNSDGDGEKSLGRQAAESMANNKQDATQTSPVTPSAKTPSVSAQVSSSVTAPVHAQATTSLGLNATALPADLDLDLLGLNTSGQLSGGNAPQNANATLVRFGALPGQAQATQVPNTAIALQIAKHVAKGVSTFEIRIDPPEMGRVDVKLELAQDGRVTAHLAVEKSETLDLLQRDAKALEQALRDAGLDADADTLNFSLKDGSSNDEFGAGAQGDAKTNPDENDATTNDDALITALSARQIEAAARGGIDVSI